MRMNDFSTAMQRVESGKILASSFVLFNFVLLGSKLPVCYMLHMLPFCNNVDTMEAESAEAFTAT